MNIRNAVLALTLLGVSQTAHAKQMPDKLITAGWIENVIMTSDGLQFKAKLDTGADTSSINAQNIRQIIKDGKASVRFTLKDDKGKEIRIVRPISRMVKIRSRSNASLIRVVVKLKICVGGLVVNSEFNLTDRGRFRYQVLLGRSLLAHRIVVRSGPKGLVSDRCNMESMNKS